MGAIVEEVLMGPGSWNFDVDWDDEVAKALRTLPGPHLLLYWGERLYFVGPVTGANLDHEGIPLHGRNLLWHLGSGGDGPNIADRDYVSGANHVDNGDFALGELYWRLAEATKWVITGGQATMSAKAVGSDDVLASMVYPARSGQVWLAVASVALVDLSSVGGVRLRIVLEGKFRPQNLVANADFAGGATGWTFTTNSFGSPAAAVVGGQLRLGPVPQRQVLANPKFDLGLDPWIQGDHPAGGEFYLDDQHPFSPAYSATTPGTGVGSKKSLFTIASLGSGPGGLIQPGERYRLDCNILPTPAGVDGEAYAAVDYYRFDGSSFELVRAETQHVRGTDEPGTWRNVSAEFDSDTYQAPLVWLLVFDHTDEFWSFDDVYLTRIEGNEVQAEGGSFAVVPGLAYDLAATVTSGVDGQAGSVVLRVRLSAAGRPDITVPVTTTEHTGAVAYRATGGFTPPSGYDTARLQIVGKDILGTYFAVDDVDVRQADDTVIVKDGVRLAAGVGGFNAVAAVPGLTPTGTDSIRVEVVAEAGTAWAVDNVSLGRLVNGSIPSTGLLKTNGEIVRELLRHPDTGLPLLSEGTITGADYPAYDWRIVHMTNAAALAHLSRAGVASPVREYRVRPDGRVDWGTAAQIFTTREQAVFAGKSLVVLDPPDVEISAEATVEKVRVIGVERRAPTGEHVNIEGEATNPSAGTDFFGRPVSRTRVVQDGQVDHPGYAAALARDLADKAAASPDFARLRISDWEAEQDFDVGDTVYLYKPEAGLADSANGRTMPNGEVVFPARRRVTARTLRCGPGPFKALLRLPDGSTLPLKVRWEAQTSAAIEVGNPRPEFLNDPQGGPAGVQFIRYRAYGAR